MIVLRVWYSISAIGCLHAGHRKPVNFGRGESLIGSYAPSCLEFFASFWWEGSPR